MLFKTGGIEMSSSSSENLSIYAVFIGIFCYSVRDVP